jgi:glycine/D-amino acid oxidase-like deaminating enzyme
MVRAVVDVAIVGGGILGTLVAARMRDLPTRLRVICLRRRDAERPNAESLRNQGWSQSGLRYQTIDKVTAELMWTSRGELHDWLGVQQSDVTGVTQMSAADEEGFVARIERSPWEAKVRKLDKDEAKQLVGNFWDEEGVCFAVPEHHLDISRLMTSARARARTAGVEFREVDAVEIDERSLGTSSIRLLADQNEVEAGVVVFTAGCGNLPFLHLLKSPQRYQLRQTPLLVVMGPPITRTPVFYDSKNGISVISHDPCRTISKGCMIIGTKFSEPRNIMQYDDADKRIISREEANQILEQAERYIPELGFSRYSYRFTAGWEPIPPDLNHFKPQVFFANEEHRHIIFAFSGRATLSAFVSEEVVKKIKYAVRLQNNKAVELVDLSLIGTPWVQKIQMHYEDYYNELNDYVANSGGIDLG